MLWAAGALLVLWSVALLGSWTFGGVIHLLPLVSLLLIVATIVVSIRRKRLVPAMTRNDIRRA
jgi:hypothetical protein